MMHFKAALYQSPDSGIRPLVAPINGLVLIAIGVLGVVGCGSGSDKVVPVSGTITLDGQPLAGANITFQPTGGEKAGSAGPGSGAVTDAAGKYVLKTAEAKPCPGAVVGKHTVRITGAQDQRAADDDTQRPPAKDPVPAHYRDGSLTFEVPAAGTDKADFALQSGPAGQPKGGPVSPDRGT
jgi:hypothetical protein